MKKLSHIYNLLVLGILIFSFIYSCTPTPKVSQGKQSTEENLIDILLSEAEKQSNLMIAPDIQPTQDGFITLDMCPTTHKNLMVEVNEDGTEAKIYYNGELLQTIIDEEGLAVPPSSACIQYMDANFDGYTDILLGCGESHSYGSLLVWNPIDEKFQRIGSLGEPSLQGFMLHVASKSVIEGGSGGAGFFSISRSVWTDYKLQTIESLEITYDLEDYFECDDINVPFTVRDAQDEVIAEIYNQELLPSEWKTILKAYNHDDIYFFIGIEAIKKLCESNPHQAKKKLQGGLFCINGEISHVSEDADRFVLRDDDSRDFFSIDCTLKNYSSVIENSHKGDIIQVKGRFTGFYSSFAEFEVFEVEAL